MMSSTPEELLGQCISSLSEEQLSFDNDQIYLRNLDLDRAKLFAEIPDFNISEFRLTDHAHNTSKTVLPTDLTELYIKKLDTTAPNTYGVDIKIPLHGLKKTPHYANPYLQELMHKHKDKTQPAERPESQAHSKPQKSVSTDHNETSDEIMAANAALASAVVVAGQSANELRDFAQAEKIPGKGEIPIGVFKFFIVSSLISAIWFGTVRFAPLSPEFPAVIAGLLENILLAIFLVTVVGFGYVTWRLLGQKTSRLMRTSRVASLFTVNSLIIIILLTMAGGGFPSLASGHNLSSPLLGEHIDTIGNFSDATDFYFQQLRDVLTGNFVAISQGTSALHTWPRAPLVHILLALCLLNFGRITWTLVFLPFSLRKSV